MERHDEPWFSLDRARPRNDRGPPWCVRVGRHDHAHALSQSHAQAHPLQYPPHQHPNQHRVCFLTAWPSVIGTAERLIAGGIVRKADALIVNENMARGEAVALASMRRFAAEVANASSLIGRAHASGVHVLWREKSPQTFSDSPSGSYQHVTYGSPHQRCTVPSQTTRSPAVDVGLTALEAAGVRPISIWDATITQADQYLASRTPYVATKLDCTHFCEPSGTLEMWVDVTLHALVSPRRRQAA